MDATLDAEFGPGTEGTIPRIGRAADLLNQSRETCRHTSPGTAVLPSAPAVDPIAIAVGAGATFLVLWLLSLITTAVSYRLDLPRGSWWGPAGCFIGILILGVGIVVASML